MKKQGGDLRILGLDISHDILVEELKDEGDAISEDQVLRHELKLVDVVEAEVLEEEEQRG